MSNKDLLELHNSIKKLKTIEKKYFNSNEDSNFSPLHSGDKTKNDKFSSSTSMF